MQALHRSGQIDRPGRSTDPGVLGILSGSREEPDAMSAVPRIDCRATGLDFYS